MTDLASRPPHPMARPTLAEPTPQRTRAIMLARAMTLTRAERMDFTELLFDARPRSWSELDELTCQRLADALTAYLAVQHILNERRR